MIELSKTLAIFKMIILLDHKSNWDKKLNNCVVQAGEAARGPLVNNNCN